MQQCRSCGLLQVAPMPSKKEIQALYHEDLEHFTPYIDQLSVHRAYFQKKIEEIYARVKRHKGIRMLDIGCAMGVLLEEAGKKGMQTTGVDISADAVSYCTKKGLRAYVGTIQSLKSDTLRTSSFDVITAFQIIEHERDPLDMMKRVYKLLKKGGIVILATPNSGGFFRKIMGKRWVGFAHPEHVVLLDFQSMRTLLKKAGFVDIEIRNDTPRPFPLSFAFRRASDYFPWVRWLLVPLGHMFDHLDIKNPINPWDDMIVFAKKQL